MNLFELFIKIGVDDQASDKLADLSSKLGNGLKTAAKIGTAAVGAAAAGIAALTTASVNNYAEYEQLVGGAELMFGDAYDFVAEKAKNAYSTVQMSQNDYLRQVNGFATGLKTALGGNAQAAAELADQIVNAEADVVAATGASQEMVQNAFNGIMRSNYVMLDNLQLGITPTKEGFQEVIDKVNEWNAANGRATNYVIDNLADAQSALVDYIEMQGLQGYAANEAADTIQGSLASMKSAWENLLTGVADDNADFEELVNNFVDSVETAGKNIIPRIETILGGIGTLVTKLSPIISQEVPALVHKVLPSMLNAGIQLLGGVIQGLIGAFPSLVSAAKMAVPMLIDGIATAIPQLMSAGGDIIEFLVNGIVNNGPQLLQSGVDTAVGLIDGLSSGLSQSVPQFLGQALPMLLEFTGQLRENAGQLVDAGLNLIMQLVKGITDSLPVLVENIPTIVSNIAGIINDNAPKILGTGVQIIVTLVKGIIHAIPTIIENIPQIIKAIVDVIQAFNWMSLGKSIITAFKNGITNMVGAVKTAGSNVHNSMVNAIKQLPTKLKSIAKSGLHGFISAVKGLLGSVKGAATSVLTNMISGISKLPSKLLTIAKNAIKNIISAFTTGGWKNVGSNIVSGIASGIAAGASKIISAAAGAAKSALNAAKQALGIHSPSRVFRDQVGANIALGLADGILDNAGAALDAVSDLADDMTKAMQLDTIGIDINPNLDTSAISATAQSTANGLEVRYASVSTETSAYSKFSDQLDAQFEHLFQVLSEYFPQFASAQVVLDTGATVGQMAPAMDVALGKLATARRRGR